MTGLRSASSLLALMQISDSAFPSGAFAHSYGLEQLARERRIKTPVELEAFVRSVLTQSVATSDAPAAYTAARAAMDTDLTTVLDVDRALYRTKSASELRNATLQTGRRLLDETAAHIDDALLADYRLEVHADPTLGTHAVSFGVVGAALGVGASDIAAALMLGSATAILQASMRLLPISHRDVQAILHGLRPKIAVMATETETTGPSVKLMSFNPLQEIAAMRHAFATARLFAS